MIFSIWWPFWITWPELELELLDELELLEALELLELELLEELELDELLDELELLELEELDVDDELELEELLELLDELELDELLELLEELELEPSGSVAPQAVSTSVANKPVARFLEIMGHPPNVSFWLCINAINYGALMTSRRRRVKR